MESIRLNSFSPVSVFVSDKEGLDKPSRIASYQKSLIVGTEEGKVAIVSKIEPLADFFENTFETAVKGFGLHKKNEKVVKTDLEAARRSHQQVSRYLDRCGENIKSSFDLTVPAKLNGPQHSVSSVTQSTIKFAIDSFRDIQDNLILLSNVQADENKSDNIEEDSDYMST